MSGAAEKQRPLSVCMVALHAFPVLAGKADMKFVGGAEIQQIIVGKELVRRGYRVSMICMDHGQPDRSVFDGITVLNAYRPNAGIPVVRFLWPRLISVWRCLKAASSDIYYTRTASVLAGAIAVFCRRYRRTSVFAGAGNPDFERRTSRIGSPHHTWIYEYGLRNVDCILVQNEEQKALCARNFGRDAVLIPNCYPDPGAPRAQPGDYILWVSTIRKLKRPEYVLELARLLPHRRFRMIGGPEWQDETLYERIEKEAKRIRNVEFLGFVPYADIDEHFAGACVVINTSESEGFPNTFLQAWARGVPTVSLVDCGARFQGEPIAVSVGSLTEMAGAIEQLASDEQRRSDTGRLSRRYYEQVHKPETVIGMYDRLFTELVSA